VTCWTRTASGPRGWNCSLQTGRRCYGLFVAASFDEGDTWPVRRLVSPGDGERYGDGAWTGEFRADRTHGEPCGYLAATQTPDGVVHLLSSALHYRFDAAWLFEGRDGPEGTGAEGRSGSDRA